MSATRRPLPLAAAFLVREGRTAIRYGIGVGRAGFTWSGTALVERKAKWPGWRPTEAMVQREWDDRPRFDNQIILFR